MLSMYCRHQTCDHTNKIIKRSTKGKPCTKRHILRRKEFKGAAVSNPVAWAPGETLVWSKENGKEVLISVWGIVYGI